MNGAADGHILFEQVERIQQVGPIVLSPADERKLLGPRVADVDGDVPEILGDPPKRYCRGMTVTTTNEIRGEHRRNDELHQCSAQEADELAKRPEHEMTAFVDREIETIEKPVMLRMKKEEESVGGENRGESQPRALVQRARTQRRKADGESPVC